MGDAVPLISVIPAEAGIQEFQVVTNPLDTRFRGYDDFFTKASFIGLWFSYLITYNNQLIKLR